MRPQLRHLGVAVLAVIAVAAQVDASHTAPIPYFAENSLEVLTARASAGAADSPTPSVAAATTPPAFGAIRTASASITQSPGNSVTTPVPTATSTNGGGDTANTGLYILGTVIVSIIVGFVARQYLGRQRL